MVSPRNARCLEFQSGAVTFTACFDSTECVNCARVIFRRKRSGVGGNARNHSGVPGASTARCRSLRIREHERWLGRSEVVTGPRPRRMLGTVPVLCLISRDFLLIVAAVTAEI